MDFSLFIVAFFVLFIEDIFFFEERKKHVDDDYIIIIMQFVGEFVLNDFIHFSFSVFNCVYT